MSNLRKLRRLYLLIEKVENTFYPSLQDILDYYYEHDFNVSERTIQGDIQTLRLEFGVEIIYYAFEEGYYIDKDKSININSFYRFLEYANTAELISESIKENKSNLEFIHFESQGELKGLTFLKDLMFAVKNQRIISFQHYNFSNEAKKSFTLYPYGLKEYQNRWYIVGYLKNVENPLKFGIDRIENLVIYDQTFKQNQNFNINDLFDDVIGLSHTERETQEIILYFTPFQGKYIKTLPLHPSQQLLEDNADGVKVRITVKPNFELIQKLMMQCEAVKVLEPKWLSDEMQRIYYKALNNYEE